ncbi:MAG: hypothetical protein J5985_03030 [Kiritimatiellae bacterium]|nr:hypothetical protein [Kiritimatiellia bacterium]
MNLKAVSVLIFAAFAAVNAYPQKPVLEEVKSFVSSHWNKLCKLADKTGELRDEMDSLPEHSVWFWTSDKRTQRREIRQHLQRARELLLSTDSQHILKANDRLEEKITEAKQEIDKLRNERIVNPDKAEKYDQKIKEWNEKIDAFENSRAEIKKQVLDELATLGLKLTDKQAECFFANVCSGSIIDNTIVAAGIRVIVDNLRDLMRSSDINSAKRYFGMYITLVDIQIECFQQYIEANRDDWMPGVGGIVQNAEATCAEAERNAKDKSYTLEQRAIFTSNAAMNRRTLSAAKAYLSMLAEQEKVVAKKMETAQRIRDVALNSYNTVRLAGDFLTMMKSSGSSFDAILKMDLPEVFAFDDSSLRQEFQNITHQLQSK